MRGYLQRLVAARDVQGHSAPASTRPALPSRSPIAEADQRLGVAAIADAVAAFAPEGGAPEAPSQPLGESRTVPSYKMQGQAQPPSHARPVPVAPTTVPRYAMPMPAVATAAPPPAAAAPHPAAAAPATPIAEPAQVAERTPAALPSSEPVPKTGSAEPAPARRDESTRPLPPPEMRVVSVHPTPTAEAPRLPEAVPPEISLEPLQPVAVERPDRPVAVDEPQSFRPQPSPRDRMTTSEIRLPPPRPAREIELIDGEPAHAPAAPQDRIVVRETIRTPVEIQQKPQPPQQKAPRTAAEASVIGPLPRPELTRARVELWLR
jgi:hypothetical protein